MCGLRFARYADDFLILVKSRAEAERVMTDVVRFVEGRLKLTVNAAKSRVTTRPLTLQEFPSRVLLQCMGRAGPNVEQLTRDLEALLSGQAVTTPATPAAAAPAAPADGAQSLDMTTPT